MLLAGCGGSDATVEPPPVTVTVSDWTAGDCGPAGRHAGSIYRVCYATPEDRALEVLRDGRSREIPVQDPPGAKVGHWRWAAISPDGTRFVATWSAECEVPIAFVFPVEGGTPVPVTGEADWTQAPEAEALGWTTDGEPIVRLLYPSCGRGGGEPGTYVYEEGGPRRVDDALDASLEPRDV